MSGAVFFVLMVFFFVDLFYNISFPLVSPHLTWTSGEWYTGTAVLMAAVITFVEEYEIRRIPRGVVTIDGILFAKNNTLIPFYTIEKITIRQQRGIAAVQTAAGEAAVRIDDREAVKLARAGFMHWAFKKGSAVISRGPEGAELHAEYRPTGKYANRYFTAIVTVAAFLGLLFLLDIIGVVFFISLPLLFLFFFIIDYHKEVVVTIKHSGIKLRDEHLAEYFMAFDEIATVEKGWVRTKLTAKDGRAMHLPRALYLLPEFIAEYAKPRHA